MTSLSNHIKQDERQFQSLVLLTVITVYLLILAGGIVRSTGSGMGCPDWPKCFGHWIPPTHVSQLPPNYEQVFKAKLKGEVEFNAVKTWIEYVNRLLGVLSGLFVFITLVLSFKLWSKDKEVVAGSFLAFLLIGANGWLGSRVVATELAPYLVTLHLFLAILVVAALLYVLVRVSSRTVSLPGISDSRKVVSGLLVLTMVLTLGQVLLGTQVRDVLDNAIKQLGYSRRNDWIANLDWHFYVHRSSSLIVLALHTAVIYSLYKTKHTFATLRLTCILIAVVLVEIITGASMAYFAVPAAAQPIHLLLAVVIVGLQFVLLLLFNPYLVKQQVHIKRTHVVNA